MKATLLDVNLLIALAWPSHVHHHRAHAWFAKAGLRPWATCPHTELGFVRISSNQKIVAGAASPRAAAQLLRQIVRLPNHVFWKEDFSIDGLVLFDSIALAGHRQVTDAYLVELAQRHRGRLATLDRGIPELLAHAPHLAGIVELVS